MDKNYLRIGNMNIPEAMAPAEERAESAIRAANDKPTGFNK